MSLSTLLHDTVNFKSNTQFSNAIFHSERRILQSRRDSIKIVYCNVKRKYELRDTDFYQLFFTFNYKNIESVEQCSFRKANIPNIPHNLWYF